VAGGEVGCSDLYEPIGSIRRKDCIQVQSAEIVLLGFTKLIVGDVDRMSAFYAAVCGLIEEGRGEDRIAGEPMQEVYFKSDPPGTGTFTLTKFLDRPNSSDQRVILGFITRDIGAFVRRAQEAGGCVVEEPHARAEHGVKVAFVTDLENNLIEVVELL
jgi:predicted enzyme related to lactoylglutathione lyase